MISLAQLKYTHEEVLKMLKANERYIKYKYYLLDKKDINIGELYTVQGSISENASTEIAKTANITMKENEFADINLLDERIRPVFCIKTQEGEWLEYALGTFIMSSPKRSLKNNAIYRDIDAYDSTIILKEDKVDTRYYIPVARNYVTEITTLLQTAGITKININSTELVTSVPLEFEIGTSKLEVINALLKSINYDPLHFDNYGFATSKQYIEPAARKIEHTYRTDQESIIKQGTEQGLDLFNVPNIFVRYTETPDSVELRSKFINNDVGNILSTVRRGRNIVDVDIVDDIADQKTLNEYVRRLAIEKSLVYEDVYMSTAIMPNHDYKDCIFLQHKDLDLNAKYIESSWDIDLVIGGTMRHKLKKVVAFNAV